MVNPKKEPGFEHPRKEHGDHDRVNHNQLNDRWADRMKSKLLRMSRGAQNFWLMMPWPRGSNQCKARSHRSKK